MSDWSEVKPSNDNLWDFDKNKKLIGTLVDKRTGVGPNNSMMYVIESEGARWSVWGSTALDMSMNEVSLGQEVYIEYQGKVTNPKNGRVFKAFKVFTKPGVKNSPISVEDIPV